MNTPPSIQCLAYLRQALSRSTRHTFSGCPRRPTARRSLCTAHKGKVASPPVASKRRVPDWRPIIDAISRSALSERDSHIHLESLQAQAARASSDIQVLTTTRLLGLLESCRKLEAWQELDTIYQKYYAQTQESVAHVPSSGPFHYHVLAQYKLKNHQFMHSLKLQLEAGHCKELYKVETINIVLHYYVKQGQLTVALTLFEALEKAGYALDIVSYNTILNGARAGAGSERFLNYVLKNISSRGITFSAETYNILVSVYNQLGMHNKALSCFREALATNKALTSTYNTIISQELSREFWNSAWSLLLTMKRHAVVRNERTYSPFLLFLTKNNGPPLRMTELLEMMDCDAVTLGPASYNTMLHTLLFSGMYDDAQKVLSAMGKKSVQASERTFDVIQHFLEQCSTTFFKHPLYENLTQFTFRETLRNPSFLAYESVKSINSTQARNSARPPLQPHTLSIVSERGLHNNLDVHATGEHIQALMATGTWKSALASFKSFKNRGIKPPTQIIISVLLGLLHHKKYYEARCIYQAVRNKHPATSDIRFQTVVLNVMKPQYIVRDIQLMLKFLVKTESRIDIVFHSAASWRLYREQKYPEAIALLRYAIGLGLLLDLAAWVILVECYAKTKNLLSTIWCLQTMKDNKIILDRQARKRFKRVISTLETDDNSAQVDQAWELLDHLRYAAAEERAVQRGLSESGSARKEERPFVRHVPRTKVVQVEEEFDEETRMLGSSSM